MVIFIVASGFYSCEKDLEIDIPSGTEDIIVYGFIEQGQFPVVMLTKSIPIFESTNLTAFANSFVRGASIQLYDGVNTILLKEFPVSDLKNEPFVRAMGIEAPDDVVIPIYFYYPDSADRQANKLRGVVGRSYELLVSAEGKTLTASTIIPAILPLDSMWVSDHPDIDKYPELVRLWVAYADPGATQDFIRYFTQQNSQPFFPGYFQSVFSDELLNGQRLEFPLDKGQTFEPDTFQTYGYFKRGDTIIIRWASIDKDHFDFWKTLETDKVSAGSPFGTPTKIKTNIEGGLGIWGGYGTYYDTLMVPK